MNARERANELLAEILNNTMNHPDIPVQKAIEKAIQATIEDCAKIAESCANGAYRANETCCENYARAISDEIRKLK
jgi:hypothetical protein